MHDLTRWPKPLEHQSSIFVLDRVSRRPQLVFNSRRFHLPSLLWRASQGSSCAPCTASHVSLPSTHAVASHAFELMFCDGRTPLRQRGPVLGGHHFVRQSFERVVRYGVSLAAQRTEDKLTGGSRLRASSARARSSGKGSVPRQVYGSSVLLRSLHCGHLQRRRDEDAIAKP